MQKDHETNHNLEKKESFYNYSLSDLEALIGGLGKEKFRAQQLFRWVYGKRITEWEQMTNLSKDFRKVLEARFEFPKLPVVQKLKSLDGTIKYLFDVGQGETIESVMIPSKGRYTVCLSSEVGCNMACRFCFTGKQKMRRRLESWEIVAQFLQVNDDLAVENEASLTNIVFMGMGEPLDNPDAVFKSIEILQSPWGVNFGRRRVTVSTSGIVPLIPRITEAGVRLAVSLNGVDDEVRSRIMPINNKWPLANLLEACLEHTRQSRDKVTFEYVLLKGVTDSLEDAKKLYRLTRSIPCKINIIPFNEHPGSGFFRPEDKRVEDFQNELIRLGAHVLRRKTMGRDIYAACGQLRSAYADHPGQMRLST